MFVHMKRLALPVLLGAAIVMLMSGGARAGWFPETRLTVAPGASYLSGNNARSLVTGADGDIHLAWYDYRSGEAEIYYRRFDGVAWSPEAALTSTEYSSEYPSLAADGEGGVHLVWSRYGASGGRIFHKYFDGSAWGAEEAITENAAAAERPSAAVDNLGRLHVVWREYSGGDWHIYHKMYDGLVWSDAYALSDVAGYPRYASIAAGEDGRVHVVWDDYRHGNWEIYYIGYEGGLWGTEQRLTMDAGASESPVVILDSDGNVHVFWDDDRDGSATIYHKMNDGLGWTSDEPVVVPVEFAVEPYAVAGDSGRIHLAWYDEAGTAREVYYQEFDGSSWSEKQRISVNNDMSRGPALAVGGDGVVHVVWYDDRKGNYEIYWRANRDIPRPEIVSITPDSEYAYQEVHIIDLAGTGFFAGATVRLEKTGEADIPASNTVVESGTRITCDFQLWVEGYWDVVVQNLDGQADTLSEGFYAVPLPKPEILSIDPSSAYAYQDVHITDLAGTGFFPGAKVRLQRPGEADINASNVTVVAESLITCDFTLGVEGYWDVVVTNVDGKSDTLAGGFYSIPLPKPEIASIEPDSGYATQEVHVTDLAGTGFFPQAEVWLEKTGEADIVATNVVVESLTRISCDLALTAAGHWDVLVRNVDGKSDTLAAGFYVVPLPNPELVSITPNIGRAYESIYISDLAGDNFFSGADVWLRMAGEGDIYAEDVTCESPQRITCGFGLSGTATGLWDVIIRNPDGITDTLASAFEVIESLWGDGVRLTYDDGYSSTSRPNAKCIDLDSMGEPHIVWYDDRSGDYEIYYKSHAGGTWGPDVRLTTSSGTAEYPAIALDSNDHVHVVWSDDRDGRWEIYHKVYDGTSWQPDTRVTNGPGGSSHPSIAVDGDDNLHLVWQNDASGSPHIFYGSYDGVAWSLAGCIEPAISGSGTPAVAVDGFNHVHVVWYQDASTGDHLYYKSYDGTMWGESVALAATRLIYGPTIAVDSRNMVHVAWHDGRYGASDYEVFYRRFDGLAWGPEVRITSANHNSHNATLAADGAGNTYIMWVDARSGVNKLFYARHDGAGWGGDVLLAAASNDARLPSAASTPDGVLHVIWRDSRDGNEEIYYKRRGPDPLAGEDEAVPRAETASSLVISPNPVRNAAEIRFHIGSKAGTDLAIYDIAGRLVSKTRLGDLAPGAHSTRWDMTDRSGRPVAPGIYFIKLTAGSEEHSAKLVVIR